MNPFGPLAYLFSPVVPPDAIRSEIYFLGSRHQGEALDGAIEELKLPGLQPGRVRLLRAVIEQLSRAERIGRVADPRV